MPLLHRVEFVGLLLVCLFCVTKQIANLQKTISNGPHAPKSIQAMRTSIVFLNDLEEKAFHAIKYVHEQMDDDHSGNIDLSESDEYIREELNTAGQTQTRQNSFHGNDYQISVEDLWNTFKKSPVYNWTTEDVVGWLKDQVDLPKHVQLFREKGMTGLHLPLLAANQDHYFTKTLGRFSIEDKRKIIIKATDVVIFGPPVKYRQIIKDILLGCAILIASTCAWFADNQSKKSKRELSKLQTQIEMLSKTESDLKELQVQLKSDEQMKMELEQSRNEEAKERQSLTEEIKKVRTEADKLREMRMHSDENSESLCLAEEELQQVRKALKRAEMELHSTESFWVPAAELQRLLQATYKQEIKNYALKKQAAERQLTEAKEFCEKVRKKRDSVFTMMTMPHRGLMDKVDERIQDARQALEQVGEDLQERRQRWQQIESICGISIRSENSLMSPVYKKNMEVIDELETSSSGSDPASKSFSFQSEPSSRSSHLTNKRRSNASQDSDSFKEKQPMFYIKDQSPNYRFEIEDIGARRTSTTEDSFNRTSTLPKSFGHPRSLQLRLESGMSRCSSETVLNPKELKSEDEKESSPMDSDNGFLDNSGLESSNEELDDVSRTSPNEHASPISRVSAKTKSASKNKAKKLFHKFLSRDKINEAGTEKVNQLDE